MADHSPTVEDDSEFLFGDVLLGGYDCETCGYNRDTLTWHYDAGIIHLRLSVGCYHSEQLQTSDLEEALSFIEELKGRSADWADKLTAEAANMRAALAHLIS